MLTNMRNRSTKSSSWHGSPTLPSSGWDPRLDMVLLPTQLLALVQVPALTAQAGCGLTALLRVEGPTWLKAVLQAQGLLPWLQRSAVCTVPLPRWLTPLRALRSTLSIRGSSTCPRWLAFLHTPWCHGEPPRRQGACTSPPNSTTPHLPLASRHCLASGQRQLRASEDVRASDLHTSCSVAFHQASAARLPVTDPSSSARDEECVSIRADVVVASRTPRASRPRCWTARRHGLQRGDLGKPSACIRLVISWRPAAKS